MVELLTNYNLSKGELEEELKAERFEDTGEESEVATSEKEYREAALRVVLQRNDFLLQNLIDMFRTHKTLEVSPYYQRRARWDITRQSKLIESFLVNIPVPPVFLYEVELANYEIMDGQQRVSAILEYYDNKFALRGLEILKSLEGKRYHELPSEIKAGLLRRSLSAYILLRESTSTPESAGILRRRVFERLNTGGIRLNAQEIRNSVNSGPFNYMLLELSRNSQFTKMWDIPPFEPNERTNPSAKLRRNSLFKRMADVELVLRVFALLDPNNIRGGMRSTLDFAMEKYSKSNEMQLKELKDKFLKSLELADAIGGADVCRLPSSNSKRRRPSAPLFDGIMVALMRHLNHEDKIKARAGVINEAIQTGFDNSEFYELIVGRANTRASTIERSKYIEGLIKAGIAN